MKLRGHVKAVLRDKDGKVKLVREGKNLVTDVGKNLITNLVETAGPTRPSHVALGTSGTTPLEADTVLGGEIAGSRTAIGTTSRIDNELTYEVTITATGAWAIQEAGIFNAGAGGTMLARWLTQVFSMIATETLEITWTLNFGD